MKKQFIYLYICHSYIIHKIYKPSEQTKTKGKMPIEDVDYLLSHSEQDSYIVNVDSSKRDKVAYPTPSEFSIDFDNHFNYVFGVDILDVSMPSSMWNIEKLNNEMKYYMIWFNPFFQNHEIDFKTFSKTYFHEIITFPEFFKFIKRKDNNRILFTDYFQKNKFDVKNIVVQTVKQDNILSIRRKINNVPFVPIDAIDLSNLSNKTLIIVRDKLYYIENVHTTTLNEILLQDHKTVQIKSSSNHFKHIYEGKTVNFPIYNTVGEILSKESFFAVHILHNAIIYGINDIGNDSALQISIYPKNNLIEGIKNAFFQHSYIFSTKAIYFLSSYRNVYNTDLTDEQKEEQIIKNRQQNDLLESLYFQESCESFGLYREHNDKYFLQANNKIIPLLSTQIENKINLIVYHLPQNIVQNISFQENGLIFYHLRLPVYPLNYDPASVIHLPKECLTFDNLDDLALLQLFLPQNNTDDEESESKLYVKIKNLNQTESGLDSQWSEKHFFENFAGNGKSFRFITQIKFLDNKYHLIIPFNTYTYHLPFEITHPLKLNIRISAFILHNLRSFLKIKESNDNLMTLIRLPLKRFQDASINNDYSRSCLSKSGRNSRLYFINNKWYTWLSKKDDIYQKFYSKYLSFQESVLRIFELIKDDIKYIPVNFYEKLIDDSYMLSFNFQGENINIKSDILLDAVCVYVYNSSKLISEDDYVIYSLDLQLCHVSHLNEHPDIINSLFDYNDTLYYRINDYKNSDKNAVFQQTREETHCVQEFFSLFTQVKKNLQGTEKIDDTIDNVFIQFEYKNTVFKKPLFMDFNVKELNVSIKEKEGSREVFTLTKIPLVDLSSSANSVEQLSINQLSYLIVIDDFHPVYKYQFGSNGVMDNLIRNVEQEDVLGNQKSSETIIAQLRDDMTETHEEYSRIHFHFNFKHNSYTLIPSVLIVNTRNIAIKENAIFLKSNVLKTLVTHKIQYISHFELSQLFTLDSQNNFPRLEWCPLIFYSGFFELEPGNYNLFQFVDALNEGFINSRLIENPSSQSSVEFPFVGNNHIRVVKANNKGDLTKTGQIQFVVDSENISFMIDLKETSLNENIGFSVKRSLINKSDDKFLILVHPEYGDLDILASISNDNAISQSKQILRPPGVVYLLGYRYVVLRCPEIESLIGVDFFDKHSSGIGVFILGVNQQLVKQRLDFVNFLRKPFHPIEKLKRLTFRFELPNGSLYDFKGVDMFMVLQIKSYVPKKKVQFDYKSSQLNPNYNPDFIQFNIDQDYNKQKQRTFKREHLDNLDEYDSDEANELVHIQNKFDGTSDSESYSDNSIFYQEKQFGSSMKSTFLKPKSGSKSKLESDSSSDSEEDDESELDSEGNEQYEHESDNESDNESDEESEEDE